MKLEVSCLAESWRKLLNFSVKPWSRNLIYSPAQKPLLRTLRIVLSFYSTFSILFFPVWTFSRSLRLISYGRRLNGAWRPTSRRSRILWPLSDETHANVWRFQPSKTSILPFKLGVHFRNKTRLLDQGYLSRILHFTRHSESVISKRKSAKCRTFAI